MKWFFVHGNLFSYFFEEMKITSRAWKANNFFQLKLYMKAWSLFKWMNSCLVGKWKKKKRREWWSNLEKNGHQLRNWNLRITLWNLWQIIEGNLKILSAFIIANDKKSVAQKLNTMCIVHLCCFMPICLHRHVVHPKLLLPEP